MSLISYIYISKRKTQKVIKIFKENWQCVNVHTKNHTSKQSNLNENNIRNNVLYFLKDPYSNTDYPAKVRRYIYTETNKQ